MQKPPCRRPVESGAKDGSKPISVKDNGIRGHNLKRNARGEDGPEGKKLFGWRAGTLDSIP